MSRNSIIITVVFVLVLAGGVYYLTLSDLSDRIVLPFIAHQKPMVDPHLPSDNSIADKLDEVTFDGLFNVSANPSGIIYEDGLGELVGIDENNVVTVRLKANKKWHDSFSIKVEDDEVDVGVANLHEVTAKDIEFTLQRIQSLRSLSPDYILVYQALEDFSFEGPNQRGEIRFQFVGDRIWVETDIKEVLSFKILPANSGMNQVEYKIGSSNYMAIPPQESGVSNYIKNPEGISIISKVLLEPFIDNSTFTTELNNDNINALLNTPFGARSPILDESEDYFTKSSIATTFFCVLYNTQRLNLEQRRELKRLIDNKAIVDRFYKVNTEQQRNIIDYLGNANNYADYINNSVFPSTTYYVEEDVVIPYVETTQPNLSVLPDTVRIAACTNFGFREEYNELIEILNDPSLFQGKIKATAVDNQTIKSGNYDAVLVAVNGYRSNFLFDLYNVFMRQPDLEVNKINLETVTGSEGQRNVSLNTWNGNNNFCRIDLSRNTPDTENLRILLDYMYGFMSTKEIGDKQAYAERIDRIESEVYLGSWLFSLPSLAYFSNQFDSTSIDLYGVASQLSTIEKWQEATDD